VRAWSPRAGQASGAGPGVPFRTLPAFPTAPAAATGPTAATTAAAGAAPVRHGGDWSTARTAWLLALVGWTAVVAFFALGDGSQLDITGCWVAQTAREMRESGDWVVPRFSGETRMQKSPGPYWAVILASYLRGTPVDEASARLPNACWAVLLVLTVYLLAARIGGTRVAVFAGFATASSLLVLTWSHRGGSDLGLATLVAASLASFWAAFNEDDSSQRRGTLFLLGYLTAGLGMLYKMPMPIACVGVPMVCYVVLRNRWKDLWNGWHLVGVLLFLLPWLPWAVVACLSEPNALAKWRVEYLDRFTGDLPNVEGQGAWYCYFYYLIPLAVYTLPFTLSVPGALLGALRRRPEVHRDGVWFLLIWFVSLLVFYTASVGKETRYFLPALPPVLILLGIELARVFDPEGARAPGRDRLIAWLALVLVPTGCVAGFFVLRWWHREHGVVQAPWDLLWPAYAGTAGVVALGAATAAWLYQRHRRGASFGAIVGTMWLAFCVCWCALMPMLGAEAPARDFAAQLKQLDVGQRAALRQVAQQDPRIIWHSGVRFPRVIDQLKLLEEQGGQRSLAREERLVFDEMTRQLAEPALVLFVAAREHYVRFLTEGPPMLAASERPWPPTYLWLQTRVGSKRSQFVVFGNQPPPWPEPPLTPPSAKLQATVTPPPEPETTRVHLEE